MKMAKLVKSPVVLKKRNAINGLHPFKCYGHALPKTKNL